MDLEHVPSISENLQLLLRVKKLSWISEAKASQLLQEVSARDFKREDVILDEGLGNRHICILLSGRASLFSYTNHNGGIVLAMVGPGIISYVPCFPPYIVHRYEWKAASNCRAIRVTRKRFLEITLGCKLSDDDAFDRAFESVSFNSGHLFTRYRSFLGLDLLTRVAIALLDLAENLGIRDARGVLLPHFFSHDDLADLVGASRSRVTSAVNRLEREQIVGREGRQIVVDTSGLRVFIESHA